MARLLLFTLLSAPALALKRLDKPAPILCDSADVGWHCDIEKAHFWGEFTPFYSTGTPEERLPPPGCTVNQVSYLGRHGARGEYSATEARDVDRRRRQLVRRLPPEAFNKFPFLAERAPLNLGPELQALGRHQAYNAGIRLAKDYPDLSSALASSRRDKMPVVRSSGYSRVKDTAKYIMQGFLDTIGSGEWDTEQVKVVYPVLGPEWGGKEVIPRLKSKIRAYGRWANTFENQVFRAAFGANIRLSSAEKIALERYCVLGTLMADAGTTINQWCNIYPPEYFQKVTDYYGSAWKWYTSGPGNPWVPQGTAIWVKELGVRLLGQESGVFKLTEHASPLHRKFYVDTAHIENLIPAVVALELFDETEAPFLSRYTPIDEADGWSIGRIAPMCGRLIVERMRCDGYSGFFVRFILNDGVRKLAKLELSSPASTRPGPGVYPVRDVLENVAKMLARTGHA